MGKKGKKGLGRHLKPDGLLIAVADYWALEMVSLVLLANMAEGLRRKAQFILED